MINRNLLLAAIGVAYTRATNENKLVDAALANAIADEVLHVIEISRDLEAAAARPSRPKPTIAELEKTLAAEAPVDEASPPPRPSLRDRLARVLNESSAENGAGNTPDYILANFVASTLFAFGDAVRMREEFYRRDPNQGPPTGDARMRVTLSPTSSKSKLYSPEGVECRVWEGTDDDGTKVTAFVALIAVSKDEPAAAHQRFAKQLEEKPAPGAVESWPLRMFVGDG
jgi:hypothetical protein